MTLVKDTTGCIFGGFSDVPWVCDDVFLSSNRSFLFSLAQRGLAELSSAKMCKVLVEQQAVRCHPNALVLFGAGHDLFISDNCDRNAASSVSLGTTFESHGNPYLLSCGSKNFVVSELESWIVRRKEAPAPIKPAPPVALRLDAPPAKRFAEMLGSLGGLEDFSAVLLKEVCLPRLRQPRCVPA